MLLGFFLEPSLQLFQCLEAMRDLVLLNLVHLSIPVIVSIVAIESWGMAYVWPSYSKIGSQPDIISISAKELRIRVESNLPKLVGPRAGTILPCASSIPVSACFPMVHLRLSDPGR
jgi:hypothetical protein